MGTTDNYTSQVQDCVYNIRVLPEIEEIKLVVM